MCLQKQKQKHKHRHKQQPGRSFSFFLAAPNRPRASRISVTSRQTFSPLNRELQLLRIVTINTPHLTGGYDGAELISRRRRRSVRPRKILVVGGDFRSRTDISEADIRRSKRVSEYIIRIIILRHFRLFLQLQQVN